MKMDANQYKQQVNLFCEKNCKLSAQDILDVAKKNQQKSEIKEVRKKLSWKRFVAVAAATVATVGVFGVIAGATGFGPMAALFHKKAASETDAQQAHYDVISSELSGEGYVFYRNEMQRKDQFTVTFVGVTGDWVTPQLMFEIHCFDEEFVAAHRSLNVLVYKGMSEEAYANRIDLKEIVDVDKLENCVGYDLATAYQCEDDPSSYLLSYGVYESYVSPGATIVTEVRSIRETNELYINYDKEEIMLNCKFSFDLPDDLHALANATRLNYALDDAPKFTGTHDVKYHVTAVTFSQYNTSLDLNYVYDGTDLSYIETDFWENYEDAEAAFRETAECLKLVVDGVAYEPTYIGGVYMVEAHLAKGWANFPEIDFEQAESVTLTYGDQTIKLK